MADRMKSIAITPPEVDPRRIVALARPVSLLLGEAGWDRVHLRFPEADTDAVAALINLIPRDLHPGLSLHDHQDLAEKYNLGVHLTGRSNRAIAFRPPTLSASCHSAADVVNVKPLGLDYLTISPIFDSISKVGYKSAAFSDTDYRTMLAVGIPLIALGGISHETIPLLPQGVFAGYAVLGALPWDADLDTFRAAALRFR